MDPKTLEFVIQQLRISAGYAQSDRTLRRQRRFLYRQRQKLGWLVPVGMPRVTPEGWTQDFRVRRWHPGFWLDIIRRVQVKVEIAPGPRFYQLKVDCWAWLANHGLRLSGWLCDRNVFPLNWLAVSLVERIARHYRDAVTDQAQHHMAGDQEQVGS